MERSRRTIHRILHEQSEDPEIGYDEQFEQGDARDPYPEAGAAAQPEVQAAVERYKEMSPEQRGDEPLLYWLLGSGTPPYKASKPDTEYEDESPVKGQTCANCEYSYQKLVRGEFICSQIRGLIRPAGWCNLWTKGETESE